MKPIHHIYRKYCIAAIGVALITCFATCKNYLDVAPQGAVEEEAIRTDPGAAQTLVTGVYNGLWNENVHGSSYIFMTNIASDDADKGSNATDGATTALPLDNLTMDGNVVTLNNVWNSYYASIARCNQALRLIPLSPAEEAARNQMLAEVRFVRAYLYFNLVRFFGGVPKIDTVPPVDQVNNPAFQRKTTKDSIYALIINDLQFGVDHLAVKGAAGANIGRATKGAAMGMLAKVFLYQQNWQRAYGLTDTLINQPAIAGAYGLLDNYADIWRQVGANSVESLFEVQTGTNVACNAAVNLYVVYQGPRAGGKYGWTDLGFGFDTPSESLANEYEPGDNRAAGTIIFINPSPQGTVLWDGFRIPGKDSVENNRYNYKAYHSRTAEKNCGNNDYLPKNIRILRFGEILLIHAEAALVLSNPGAALTDINRLRKRAGLLDRTSITREQIWHERRVEMAMEHDRFFDIVRQEAIQPGRAVAAFHAHGKTWTKDKNEVFPIPTTQIQLSGGLLTQNPNYPQ